ncbi:response regulator [Pedobacter sp. HMWF019]|uniref:response regulator n=1 Tax=Pedobacter sp. HMWF019 TaxID=2056856 RepID=UPI000D368527|nr:response regulator [Pedobacter sp. HMWF019]PTS97441.1 response regulator [Pedobacter sp. HMWF019]
MNKKILVFDDDQETLNALSDVLDYADWDLVTIASGNQALQVIRMEKPDLILMDILLGDTDGREICKEIKCDEELKHIPIILISGINELGDTLNQQFGPNDIIAKPFNIGEVLDKVYFQLSS